MTQLPIDEQITFLYTRDLAKSIPFYEDALGFKLALDQGGCRIYHVTGSKAYVGICERDYAPEKPEGVIFTLVTQNVDGWYDRLVSKGIPADAPPRQNDTYGIYHFFFRDPNGYQFEVQRFLTPDWDQSMDDESGR